MRQLKILATCLTAFLFLLIAGCSSDREELSRTELKRLLLDPKVKAFLVEGERAYKQGNYRIALALSDSAETYAPDLADIHFFRGRIYTDMNQLEVAQAAYETALELDPEYRGARLNMGINLIRGDKLQDALALFRQEEVLYPSSDLYLEMGRTYAALGEADSARTAYEQSLVLDSTNTTAYMWLGQLYEEMGELERALSYSRKGLQLKPDNMDYQYIVGSQLFRLGRVEEAAPYLKTVAEQRPWHHGAQYNLGQVLLRLGHEEEAEHYLARAEKAQQLTQEINDAESAISRDPEQLNNWVHLGEVLRRAGLYDRAIDAFKVAVSIDPWNLYLQNNMATLMLESGDAEGAIRRYRAILGVDSTLADIWLNLGVAYANSGRADEARQAWEKALELNPGHPTVTTYLAKLPAP